MVQWNMTIKTFCKLGLFAILLLSNSIVFASVENPYGQTIQINTNFRDIIGTPSWLLILRDEDSGQVLPYVFDIKNNENFWVAFSAARVYRVTVSSLKFSPEVMINDFCHLEGGIITGRSKLVRLRGLLSPDRNSSTCNILTYKDMPFPIADH